MLYFIATLLWFKMLKCHNLVLLLVLVVVSDGLKLEIEGDLSIILVDRAAQLRARGEAGGQGSHGRLKVKSHNLDSNQVTVPPMLECPYQYPEREQLEALLSNMMNELTKVFIRAHQMMSRETNHTSIRRYKVARKKNFQFFEDVFKNMTKKHRLFFKRTMLRSPPPADPCADQEKLKNMWSDLLDKSLDNLRNAVHMCVEEFLRMKHRSGDDVGSARQRLGRFLAGEQQRVRGALLGMLCDHYQQCYGDLL